MLVWFFMWSFQYFVAFIDGNEAEMKKGALKLLGTVSLVDRMTTCRYKLLIEDIRCEN